MEPDTRSRMIQEHLEAIRQLQAEAAAEPLPQWPPQGFYWLYHVVVGIALGMIGASVSLVMNVVGSVMVGQHPLQIIRVYLTFPMGEQALTSESGKLLFVGCVLYLVTGGLYGIVFHLVMRWYLARMPLLKRIIAVSIMGLGLWAVNFYLVLSWLQPTLLGGNWIMTEVPPWVAALTHLVFAWSMLVVEFWGRFEPLTPDPRPAPAPDVP